MYWIEWMSAVSRNSYDILVINTCPSVAPHTCVITVRYIQPLITPTVIKVKLHK